MMLGLMMDERAAAAVSILHVPSFFPLSPCPQQTCLPRYRYTGTLVARSISISSSSLRRPRRQALRSRAPSKPSLRRRSPSLGQPVRRSHACRRN